MNFRSEALRRDGHPAMQFGVFCLLEYCPEFLAERTRGWATGLTKWRFNGAECLCRAAQRREAAEGAERQKVAKEAREEQRRLLRQQKAYGHRSTGGLPPAVRWLWCFVLCLSLFGVCSAMMGGATSAVAGAGGAPASAAVVSVGCAEARRRAASECHGIPSSSSSSSSSSPLAPTPYSTQWWLHRDECGRVQRGL